MVRTTISRILHACHYSTTSRPERYVGSLAPLSSPDLLGEDSSYWLVARLLMSDLRDVTWSPITYDWRSGLHVFRFSYFSIAPKKPRFRDTCLPTGTSRLKLLGHSTDPRFRIHAYPHLCIHGHWLYETLLEPFFLPGCVGKIFVLGEPRRF